MKKYLLALLIIKQIAIGQGVTLVPKAEYNKIRSSMLPGSINNLPSRYSLQKYFPVPRSQGHQPSCVGWAVGYAYMSFYHRMLNNWSLADESHLFSPSYVYQKIKESKDCSSGSQLNNALNLVLKTGIVPLSEFAYNEDTCTAPPADLNTDAKQYKIAGWHRLESEYNFNEIKFNLANDIPVIVVVRTDYLFDHFYNKGSNDVLTWGDTPNYGLHAMVIVGYDDQFGFKLMNSWGTDWGYKGFGWVAYDSFKKMICEGYTVNKTYDSKPTVNPIIPPAPIVLASSFQPFVLQESVANDRYYFTTGIKVSSAFQGKISKVQYVYDHPTFANKYSTATKGPDFRDSYEGWGCLTNMQANVYLVDGSVVPLQFDACKLINNTAAATRTVVSRNLVKIAPSVTATQTSPGNYNFVVKLRGIEAIKDQVTKVVYHFNHESFPNPYYTETDRNKNFSVDWAGWGCLENLGVAIYFNDGTTKQIDVNMCEQLGWQ